MSTPTETDKIGHFGWYRYIGKTQISVDLYLLLFLNDEYKLESLQEDGSRTRHEIP